MFTISKEIQFDYGHRVPLHQSKCKHLHGHRGKVIAYCQSPSLVNKGPQTGMVLDFSFLKDILQTHIHDLFDHRFLFEEDDGLIVDAFKLSPQTRIRGIQIRIEKPQEKRFLSFLKRPNCCDVFNEHIFLHEVFGITFVELPVVPTAENLAFLSFFLIESEIKKESGGKATLTRLEFWETPTSMAFYER